MRLRSCNVALRTGSCALDPEHRGRHTTVVFYCDVCSTPRRGSTPHVVVGVPYDEDFAVCFMCAVVKGERRGS